MVVQVARRLTRQRDGHACVQQRPGRVVTQVHTVADGKVVDGIDLDAYVLVDHDLHQLRAVDDTHPVRDAFSAQRNCIVNLLILGRIAFTSMEKEV